MTEIERVQSGYWSFTPAGIALPGFVRELLAQEPEYYQCMQRPDNGGAVYAQKENAFQERYMQCVMALGPLFGLAPFALEAEHRRMPIQTLPALWQAFKRICTAGTDLTPARDIEKNWQHARDVMDHAQSVRRLQERVARKQRYGPSAEERLADALHNKNLPTGRDANFALMRRTLHMGY